MWCIIECDIPVFILITFHNTFLISNFIIGCIDFSDYLVLVVSYCMFEPPEIMKLCFYIFDDDKGMYVYPWW
jgi:hypothetical protein